MSKAKKKNKEEYLPLHWCKHFLNHMDVIAPNISEQDLLTLLSYYTNLDEKKGTCDELIKKYNNIDFDVRNLHITSPAIYRAKGKNEAYGEKLRDYDCYLSFMKWSKNKQVYKFDSDFMNELLKTKDTKITENIFDFLPFQTFYLDISDCKELCESFSCEGFLIRVEKNKNDWVLFDTTKLPDDEWIIHIVRLSKVFYYTDLFHYNNSDSILDFSIFNSKQTINCMEMFCLDKSNTGVYHEFSEVLNAQLYQKVVLQLLIYLSSVETDIEENEKSRETYRKPTEGMKPKNKFSEIRTWDVGVRYGSVFRKWKTKNQTQQGSDNDSETENVTRQNGSHSPKRPHYVCAHYSHFWYGKKDSPDRVRRAKWIEPYFTGVTSDDVDSPVVIHKTEL